MQESNKPTNGVINVIVDGKAFRGDSNASIRAYAHSLYNISFEQKWAKTSEPITFSNKDLRWIHTPHDDVVVIFVVIANFKVQKIMVDSRSSTNI